ncbi:Neuroligin-1, partial [Trichinella britovi]
MTILITLIYCWTLLLEMSQATVGTTASDKKIVQTSFGKLRGRIVHLHQYGLPSVEQYLGVPYGTSPTGSRRFMMPQTAAKWTNTIKDATQLPPNCIQLWSNNKALKSHAQGKIKRFMPMLKNQQEDCLFMNFYIPTSSQTHMNKKFPVLVLIHGNSYNWNAGNLYDASVLAAYGEIIVVTLNYRLGVFGFLSAGEPSCKGNWALSDIVCALDVLRALIGDFGGDSKAVTLLGWDTGAALVNLLMTSPISAPVDSRLFQRAILLGGSALSKNVGCPTYKTSPFTQKQAPVPTDVILECMRGESVENITRAASLLDAPTFLSNFGPVVDGIVVNTDPAYNLEHHGTLFQEIDLLVGMTKHEAYEQLPTDKLQFGLDVNSRDAIYRTLVRNRYEFHRTEIFNAIKSEYNDWYNPGMHPITLRDSVLEALSDALYLAPATKVTRLHARGKTPGNMQTGHKDGSKRGSTYFYLFSHGTSGRPRFGLRESVHNEDLPYILGQPLLNNQQQSLTEYSPFDFTFNKQERVLKAEPKVDSFYRAHEVAFWDNFLPSLEENGKSESNPEHHLLPRHFEKSSYFGIVKPYGSNVKIPFPPPPLPPTPMPKELTTLLQHQRALQGTPQPNLVSDQSSLNTGAPNASLSTNYSTILSVTIAVGCALLILNLLIFAGIYRQREKQKRAKRQENTSLLMQETSPYDLAGSYGGLVTPVNSGALSRDQGSTAYGVSSVAMNPTNASPVNSPPFRDGDLYAYSRPFQHSQQTPTNTQAYATSGSHQLIVPNEEESLLNPQIQHAQQPIISPLCPRHESTTDKVTTELPNDAYVNIQLGRIIGKKVTIKDVPWTSDKESHEQIPVDQKVREPYPIDPKNTVTVFTFLGIPYAQKPVGTLREPTEHRVDEDCLYLNIFTPQISRSVSTKYPVIVFFHGGGFQVGTSSDWPGHILASKGLVVVTANYRLGPFGFISLGDKHTGNYGLMDQNLVLKWVQNYIFAFNGNQDQVTIVGHGSGAVSAGLHMLSYGSEGLFHSVAAMSGSELSYHQVITNTMLAYNNTVKLGRQVGCTQQVGADIWDCLLTRSPNDIIEGVQNMLVEFNRYAFLPVIDGNFLRESPEILLKRKEVLSPVPYLTGVNRNDGIEVLLSERDLARIMDFVLKKNFTTNREAALQAIKHLYTFWPDLQNNDKTREEFIHVCEFASDAYYVAPVSKSAQLHSESGSIVYMYVNNYNFSTGAPNGERFFPAWMGVCHDCDLYLLFGFPWMPKEFLPQNLRSVLWTDTDKNVSDTFMSMWKQFARRNNPNLLRENIWINYGPRDRYYLNINVTRTLHQDYEWEHVGFWNIYIGT